VLLNLHISCEEFSVHDSKKWPMKVVHEIKLDTTEMSMIRLIFRFTLKERKKPKVQSLENYWVWIRLVW